MFLKPQKDGIRGHMTASEFLAMVDSTPNSVVEKKAYSNLVQFINKAENLTGKFYILHKMTPLLNDAKFQKNH